MAKLMLLFCLAYICAEVKSQSADFGETNLIWTVFNGRKQIAVFYPGDPFRTGPNYGTIPWIYSRKIPYGISYHYKRSILVFSDLSRRSIYFVDTSVDTFNSTEFHAGFGWVEHTAVDWISDNVYWVDGYYEWIAMKSMDSKHVHDYKIIADANVISPRGIAVDPNRGYLYWTDISAPARIVRAELDGSQQLVIATQGLINPFDITLHPVDGRVFWVDRSRDTLESVMFDGSDRKVIFTSSQGQPVGLAYYKDHIFLADTNFDDVVVLDMNTGLSKTSKKLNQRTLGITRVMTVWTKENQPDKYNRRGTCNSNNCQQDCVLTPAGKPRCLCRENFRLNADGSTCTRVVSIPHHALMLTNGTHICAYHLTALQGGSVPPTIDCFKEGRSTDDIKALAVDSNNAKVYFSSRSNFEIRALSLAGGTSSTFASGVGTVSGLTFDYVTEEVYWADAQANVIRKKKEGSGITDVLLLKPGLGDIAIDPYHRLLFYILMDEEENYQVIAHDLDYKNSTVLSKIKALQPKRMTYDDKNQRLYWTDLGKLQSVSYGGKEYPPVGTLNIRNRAIAAYGKFLMWSTEQPNGTSLIHMYKPPDKSTYRRLKGYFPGIITDFGIFDKLRHAPGRDECFTRNGGCEQICVPGKSNNKCSCSLGYTLGTDGMKCVSNMVYDNFTYATDLMSKRVLQLNLNNGDIAGTTIGQGTLVSNVVVIDKVAYWADQSRRIIKKSNMDGSNAMPIHNTANLIVQRIAVDPATLQIYYTATNGVKGIIGVVTADGTRRKTLIGDVKYVKDIKIHSGLGLMFWVERKDIPGIERATMNGGNRFMLYRAAGNSLIFGIEIDYETNMLYWCDKRDGTIMSSDFYGDNQKQIFQDKKTSITDLAIFGKYLYYTGTGANGVLKVNKMDGKDSHIVTKSHMISQLHDLSVFSTTFPAPANQKCSGNKGGCSSFCLPTNDSRIFVCECADGDTLTEDLRTCSGDLHPDLFPGGGGGGGGDTKPIPGKLSQPEEGGVNAAAIAVPIILVLIIAAVVIIAVVLYRRRQSQKSPLVCEPRGNENPRYFNGTVDIETVSKT